MPTRSTFEIQRRRLADGIEAGGEGEESDVPVDGHLVGGIGRLVVQVTLIGRDVLGVLDAVGLRILSCGVRSAG